MPGKYILDGKTPKLCDDIVEWGAWLENAERTVASDTVKSSSVSTIFLGVDHSLGNGPPLLFETRVFGGKLDQEVNRYSTWEEAEAGHQEMCERVRKAD